MGKGQDLNNEEHGVAGPLDRFVAALIDLIFLYPFISLFQAPVIGAIKSSALPPSPEALIWYNGLLSFITVFVFLVYRSLCNFFFNKTLGKKLLSLEVTWEKKTISGCLVRPLVIIVEGLVFFIPFFGVFTHHRRRILHDRITDSTVVSLKKKHAEPSFLEICSGRILGFLAFGAGFIYLTNLSVMSLGQDEVQVNAEIDWDTACELYTQVYDGSMGSVLEAFGLQQIDRSCLKQLSEKHVWSDESPVLSYMGLFIAHSEDNPSLALDYRKEICASGHEQLECQFVQWFQKKSKTQATKLLAPNSEELTGANSPQPAGKIFRSQKIRSTSLIGKNSHRSESHLTGFQHKSQRDQKKQTRKLEELSSVSYDLMKQASLSGQSPNFYHVFFLDQLLSHNENQLAKGLLENMIVTEQNQGFLQTASVYNLLRTRDWDSAFWVFQTAQLDEAVLVDFFQDASSDPKFSSRELKSLLERFYPELIDQAPGRLPAQKKNLPSRIQVLWQNLGG